MKAFLRYFVSRYKMFAHDRAYQYYMSDCALGVLSALGAKDGKRFYDAMNPAPEISAKDAKEIISDTMAKAGLRVVNTHERTGADGDAGTG